MDEQDRALSALHALDPGCANDEWVRIGMAAKAAGLSLDEFTDWSSAAPNFAGEQDCRTRWQSFKDGPVTAATLFSKASENGWQYSDRQNARQARRSLAETQTANRPAKAPQRPDSGTPNAVLSLWNRCVPATAEHPYILGKRGHPDGLRVVPPDEAKAIAGQSVAGWLVVPVLSLSGQLRTLQLIPPPGHGKKLNMPGTTFGDGLFVVGEVAQSSRVFIVEGIGQAWACWSATGCASVVCFGAGRMATVATLLREANPDRRLILVPDRGKEQQAERIARKIRAEWLALPIDKPGNYDANDYTLEYGAEDLADLLDAPKAPQARYRLLTGADLLNSPPLQWLVRGAVPLNGLASIYGASGSGKSFLALDMCAAVADGNAWFGCRVSAAPVVYVALEGEHGFSQRVKAWRAHHARAIPDGLRFVMQPFDLRESDDIAELAYAVSASGGAGGLLVIDTLNRASGGADENSSADMGELINAAKTLQAQMGGTVLLVHHSGKDAAKGMRGHSSLHAALDAAIEVTRINDRREWHIAKSKDDGDGHTFPFRLQPVDIGTDEHGDRVTSCVVVPDESPSIPRRALPPKSGNMRVIWDALGELLRDAGDRRPPNAPERLPHGRPAVDLNDAISILRERLTCEGKRKTERAQQAFTGLQAKGLIAIDGGYVWIP